LGSIALSNLFLFKDVNYEQQQQQQQQQQVAFANELLGACGGQIRSLMVTQHPPVHHHPLKLDMDEPSSIETRYVGYS
jgi:hypothetical protein